MPAIAKKQKKNSEKKVAKANLKDKTVVSGQLEKTLQKQQNAKNKKSIKPNRGVLFIKHLPHGFFEEQLKNYFAQFGKVTRLRLARSQRTGNSKGYAYVEFDVPEVAKIAAETMDNYLMFQKLVKAAYIPPEEQKYNYFKTSLKLVRNKLGKMIYVSKKTKGVTKQVRTTNNWDEASYEKRMTHSLSKLNKLKKKYSNLGINFDNYAIKPTFVDQSEEKPAENEVEEKTQPGSLLLVKRKASSEENPSNTKKEKKNKVKPKGELKELLEKTLDDEDSSDEDFLPQENDESKSNIKKQKEIKVKPKGELKELLEKTLDDEDSSDEDFLPQKNDESKSNIRKQKEIKVKPKGELKELLEKTLVDEDSSDDDFLCLEDEDTDDDDTDDEDTDDDDDNKTDDEMPEDGSTTDEDFDDQFQSDSESEEEYPPQIAKKLNKIPKPPKLDRLDKMVQRKPLTGGIQKSNKKSVKVTKKAPISKPIAEKLKSVAKEFMLSGKVATIQKTDLRNKNSKA